VIDRLLAAGSDINSGGDAHELGVSGWTVFFGKRNIEAAEFLLSRGAKTNIFAAVALNRVDVVRGMVEQSPALLDARLTEFEHGRTPLHVAVSGNLKEMVHALLQLGADMRTDTASG
jgi:ankyrin repeat protein